MSKASDDVILGKDGIKSISKRLTKDSKITISKKEIIKSLKKVKKLVDKIGKKLSMDNIEYMDSGSYGMAFFQDNIVLKLTTSKEEFKVAKGLIGKNIQHLVKYYDAFKIKNHDIWVITMDKVIPLNKKEKLIFKAIDENFIYEDVDSSYIDAFESSKVSKNDFDAIWNQYIKMVDSLVNSGISIQDMHQDNVGYLNGILTHFDLMGQMSIEDIFKISSRIK